jgi:hypothetical protein
MSTTKLIEWAAGPPPCVGWWNASSRNDEFARRWWNGRAWSAACWVGDSAHTMQCAKLKIAKRETQLLIRWRGLARDPKETANVRR